MIFERDGEVAVITVSEEGARVAERLAAAIPRATLYGFRPFSPDFQVYSGSLVELFGRLWGGHAAIVAVMASGIAVRAAAPHVASKLSDPAVVVVDDAARFAISLLSGHEGGANQLAGLAAEILGATPVVTTGTEARRDLVVGVGCRRGASAGQILAAVDMILAEHGRGRQDVHSLATIDLKEDEPGLRQAAEQLGVPLRVTTRSRVKSLQDALREETFAETAIGVASVCVPSALLSSPQAELMPPRRTLDGVAVALGRDVCRW